MNCQMYYKQKRGKFSHFSLILVLVTSRYEIILYYLIVERLLFIFLSLDITLKVN